MGGMVVPVAATLPWATMSTINGHAYNTIYYIYFRYNTYWNRYLLSGSPTQRSNNT